ncbi:MAG: hypothetical protein K7J46_13430 [Bryobacter sp.]|jgi:hypothetical protein|nr:hypothetical protein [Bryobacter sp. CoA8 C33]
MFDWSVFLLLALPLACSLLSLLGLSLLSLARPFAAMAAGAMAGAALLMLTPETPSIAALLLLATGFLLMFAVDHFLHPLCSSSAQPWPLWLSLALHFVIDGAITRAATFDSLTSASFLLHRIPEALGLPMLLRAAVPASTQIRWQILALHLCTLIGFLLSSQIQLSPIHQITPLLGGAILFLALHSLHHCRHQCSLPWIPSLSGLSLVLMFRFAY